LPTLAGSERIGPAKPAIGFGAASGTLDVIFDRPQCYPPSFRVQFGDQVASLWDDWLDVGWNQLVAVESGQADTAGIGDHPAIPEGHNARNMRMAA
jgi:hypothetical protein